MLTLSPYGSARGAGLARIDPDNTGGHVCPKPDPHSTIVSPGLAGVLTVEGPIEVKSACCATTQLLPSESQLKNAGCCSAIVTGTGKLAPEGADTCTTPL